MKQIQGNKFKKRVWGLNKIGGGSKVEKRFLWQQREAAALRLSWQDAVERKENEEEICPSFLFVHILSHHFTPLFSGFFNRWKWARIQMKRILKMNVNEFLLPFPLTVFSVSFIGLYYLPSLPIICSSVPIFLFSFVKDSEVSDGRRRW